MSPAELRRFAANLAATPARWQHFVHHAEDLRVYEQIWDDDDVNAWVICWSQDQDTGFHDHDQSAAAITMPRRSTFGIATSSTVAMKSPTAASWMKRTGSLRPCPDAGPLADWSATRSPAISDATSEDIEMVIQPSD